MEHSSALNSPPETEQNLGRAAHVCTAHGVGLAPFSAPEWTVVDDDTIMARWCVGTPDAHGRTSITTLLTTPSGSFLTTGDAMAETSHPTTRDREDLTALPFTPQHIQLAGATAQDRADMALADVRHAVTGGDQNMLAFFAPDASQSTPTTAVAAFDICDALWDKARQLQQAIAPGTRQAALRDAAELLRAQAAEAHIPQVLGDVEHEVRARVVAIASTLWRQAAHASDPETAAAYGATAEMILQPTAPDRTPAESAIAAARMFTDAMQRAGLEEVASDAAVSSVGVQAGVINALDNARDTIAETFTELADALGRDLNTSGLSDAAAKLTSAAEDVVGLLDDIDPDRRTVVEL